MKSTTAVFQSRWGFHPCNYELFLKLKRLHKWCWQSLYDFHRWHRWQRKEPQNRFGPEPTFCPALVEDKIWHKPVRIRGENGFKVYPKTVVDHGMVALYQIARMPQAEPVKSFDRETIRKIEALYFKAAEYFHE